MYAQILAGAQCLLEASNFFLSYISPDTMVKNIFTLREPKDRSGIAFCTWRPSLGSTASHGW